MAMIRPETEMKDSGIAWIGDIPSNWETIPLKKIVVDRAGGAWGNEPYENNSTICMRIADFDFDRGVFQDKSETELTKRSYKEYQIDKLLLQTNDICIEKSGGGEKTPVGRAVLFDKPYDALFANFMDRIRVDNAVSFPKYVEYYLRAMYFLSVTTLYIKQTTGIQNLNVTSLLEKEVITLPSLSEQQAIANYLDETCSKIDEIIAEAKASIGEYKELKQSVIDKAVLHGLCNGMMKDSGNDLIGKIPLSWEMRKLKYVADFNPGITTAYDAQKEVGYVPMNCVKNGYMNPLSARLSDMSTGLTGFQDGDIVIAKVTPCFENGNIAVAENLEQGVAFGSSELFVIRTHSINRRFMLYYLQNSVFKNQCISTMTGTGGLKRVSGYFVNNAYITYPPENEQQVIVNYLDEAVKNMDSLITEKESLINDLEAYKKSLIFEVVTGKRMVV